MRTFIIKIVTFIFIFSLLFYLIPKAFDKHRDSKNWEYIYNTDYNIDILFMGSSLIFTSLNPNTIDSIINYDSFNLGSSRQNIIQAYYNLVEVLKYRKINAVVLDVNSIIQEDNKLGYIYNNISGMYLSKNKINSFLNSINKNSISDIVVASELSIYNESGSISAILIKERFNWKNDIKSLDNIVFGDKDVMKNKGFFERKKIIEFDDYIVAKNKKIVNRNISIKNQKYFDDFVKLCKNNDVELILLQVPLLEKRSINQLESYTQKHDITYYDFNFKNDDDYSNYNYNDFADKSHFSKNGAEKFSLVFADSLKYFLNNHFD